MPYTSKYGRRPDEFASKSSHSHIINDPSVQEFLAGCELPKKVEDVSFDDHQHTHFVASTENPITHIIAVDGGYTEVLVRSKFPSATVAFFQIGALSFSIEDLENLEDQPFIDPSDMAKLNNIQRLKFTLPIRNVVLKTSNRLTESVRRSLYEFFKQKVDDTSLMDTLAWFIFQEYASSIPQWILASCPVCERRETPLVRSKMTKDHTFKCGQCGGEIFLTDVFRLHEAIDEELGAGGVLGYLSTTVEQFVLVHMIRIILTTKPGLMEHVLFVKDGPLAFFGQTANMHKPMRALVKYLLENHNLYLAGLEKSGAFVDHADEIVQLLEDGSILILDNDYIYKYIIPGKADPDNVYGRTSYYSNKIIFKTEAGKIYVVSLPTEEVLANPTQSSFPNLEVILTNIAKLKCDMYDNALIPVALANKLVSLANHPSSKILQKFAIGTMHG